MTTERHRVPDWKLERHLLHELPPAEAAMVGEALARDEDVSQRLAALERSNAEILRQHPPARVAGAVRARLASGPDPAADRRALGHRPLIALTLTAGMFASMAVLAPRKTAPPEEVDVTRSKGLASRLLVFRNAAATGVERLQSGSVVHQHDLVQLAYHVAARRHGVIVSVDGRGVVTRHLPAGGSESVPLETGPPVPLPAAYELDDAPGYERFFLVTADQEFPVEVVVEAVRRAEAGRPRADVRLDLPANMDQSTFVLRKESAR
jgi:anti-sigma factor RsiW